MDYKVCLEDSIFLCTLGLTQWNLNSFELFWWYQTFLCLNFAFINWDSQQGRDLATSGCKKKWIGSILFLCWLWGKWYHQIWIQTYLGFIVLILTLSPRLWGLSMHFNFHKFCVLIVWIVLLSWFDIRNSKLQFESLGKNCMESSCPNII